MTSAPVGGLRARLVQDNFFRMLEQALADLGWFDAGRQHQPVSVRDMPVNDLEEVPLNTVAFEVFTGNDTEAEVGWSGLSESRSAGTVDVYAESKAVAIHLSHDIVDILKGKMASIDRGAPNLAVYDLRQATPSLLFYVEIEDVRQPDIAHNWPQPWRQFWYSVPFTLVDTYGVDS